MAFCVAAANPSISHLSNVGIDDADRLRCVDQQEGADVPARSGDRFQVGDQSRRERDRRHRHQPGAPVDRCGKRFGRHLSVDGIHDSDLYTL